MNIKEATKDFERWLGNHTPLVKQDIQLKHRRMKADRFEFLRATYYRWAQLFPEKCEALQDAPVILAVGDLHVENFGTWRDADGRIVWGVNDFDETYYLPYTNDLVRLAVSIRMAAKTGKLPLSPENACELLLTGYADGLKSGGRPFVLADGHPKLWALAHDRLKDPHVFWQKMLAEAKQKLKLPHDARTIVEETFPAPKLKYNVFRRVAGRGSLGKQRLLAVADWAGGRIAREAKVLTPSACAWASGKDEKTRYYATIVEHAVRCPDPFLHVSDDWIVRRLAPDCTRIELAELRTSNGPARLIRAMGFETANVHLGTKGAAAAILRDLKRRESSWLAEAARAMSKATREDWEEWRAQR
jgi:uncharacterized protein (DUF2252 family)